MNFPKEKTVAFTGYRPGKIRLSSANPDIEKEIRSALQAVLRELYGRGYRRFLSGMAEGFDLWAGEEVLRLREQEGFSEIRLAAVIPFRGQEKNYPAGSWELYEKIISLADEKTVLAERYYPECFARRNDWLVDNASLVVCYFDGQSGGTQYTVRRARKAGLPVINLLNPTLVL